MTYGFSKTDGALARIADGEEARRLFFAGLSLRNPAKTATTSTYMSMPVVPSPADGIASLERAVRGRPIGGNAAEIPVRDIAAVLLHLGRLPELSTREVHS